MSISHVSTILLATLAALIVKPCYSAGVDDRCKQETLEKMTALCCGPAPKVSERTPLLYLPGHADQRKLITPPVCTSFSGEPLITPDVALCCPGVQGRTCCFLPKSWEKPESSSHWPFHGNEPFKDSWFYIAVAAFTLLLFSTVALIWFCLQTNTSHESKLVLLVRPGPPARYGTIFV